MYHTIQTLRTLGKSQRQIAAGLLTHVLFFLVGIIDVHRNQSFRIHPGDLSDIP